jgi:ribose transport system substrate-binding protein
MGKRTITAAILASLFVSAGCGGDDGEAPSGDERYLKAAEANLDKAYAGTNGQPPTSGPKPERDKNVWVISCAQSLESCARGSAAERTAGRELGWKTTIFDGKADPATFNSGIRQALADKADGIILNGIDCPLVKAALEQTTKAKVAVVGLFSLDCHEAVPGERGRFTSVNYGTVAGSTYSQYLGAWSAPRADWVITQTKGKARVINVSQTDIPTIQLIDRGFKAELKKCTSCTIVANVRFSSADIGPRLQQKVQQAILKHPEANAVHVPYDSLFPIGIAATIHGSGRSGKLKVMGGEGDPASIKLIHSDRGQDAANVLDIEWAGWAAVDSLNRLFAGERVVPQGIGWQLVDREHNLSNSGEYDLEVDFKSSYRKAWGLSE